MSAGPIPLVLTIDCSTTAAKAVILDAEGHVHASAASPLLLLQPRPGQHEQDAAQWWDATQAAIRVAVTQLAGSAASKIVAMCITHQRESFVCLDSRGVALRPAILWLDSRAGAEIAELGSDHVREVSGKPPDVTPSLYKLAWLSRHEPAVLASASRVAEVHGYLALQLTGCWATSIASADSLGLLDLRRGVWSQELLALAGVRRDQLPDLVPPGEVLAPLLDDVADDLGLPRGLPLVAGIGDGQAAGLGVQLHGAVLSPAEGGGGPEDGDAASVGAYVNLGTSMVMGVPTATYVTDPAFRTLAGAPSGTFVLETVLNAAAYLADWFRREFGARSGSGTMRLSEAPDPDLERAAAAVPPGCDGLLTLPYWNCAQTPYWDTAARGAMVGWHGSHTRAHAYRSLLEGVAFELRLHLEGLEAVTGQRVQVLRMMGGGSRSGLWTQIIADVTGREVRVLDVHEVSARGAGVLAWASLPAAAPGSAHETPAQRIATASAALASDEGVLVEPRPDAAARYDDLFAVQRRLYPALAPVFAALAESAAASTKSNERLDQG